MIKMKNFNINHNNEEKSKWFSAEEDITNDLSLLKNYKIEKIKLRSENNIFGKFEFTISSHYFKFKKVLYF